MHRPTFTIHLPISQLIDQHTLSLRNDVLRALPARAGVCMLEDADNRPVLLTASSNLRRLVRTRLRAVLASAHDEHEQARSGIVDDDDDDHDDHDDDDYADEQRTLQFFADSLHDDTQHDPWALAAHIRGRTTGSRFEQDWCWLCLAQQHVPRIAALAAERQRAWFVHVNPAARFPRFTRTSAPGQLTEPGAHGTKTADDVWLGPLPDKHAAGRLIETLEATFDLCHYHHLLVQAPHATACAYKEMGRCPAPCDGSVSLEHYRQQIQAAIAFLHASPAAWIAERTTEMQKASAALDFERAALLHRQIEDATPATRARFRWAKDLSQFRFITCQPTEHKDFARMFIIVGGWVQAILDISRAASDDDLQAVVNAARDAAAHHARIPAEQDEVAMQLMGMVSYHLFAPASKRQGDFARLSSTFDHHTLRALLHATK